MKRVLDQIAADSGVDLEAWEQALRQAVLAAGARLLETLLHDHGCGRPAESVRCECGAGMFSAGQRSKTLLTSLGPITYRRSLFVCSQCGQNCFPGDQRLGVTDSSCSPGARRMLARAGSRASFADAADDLRVYAQLEVSAKQVERVAEQVGRATEAWLSQEQEVLLQASTPANILPVATLPLLYLSFDGTGVPMRRVELLGRKGKGADGSARTREVKLGCVFTQTTTDKDGYPVREPASTTYVGAIESSEAFGWRLYAEACRRGLANAQRVVVITDGARYNQTIAQTHFPQALHIIDLYHAREHLHNHYRLLYPRQNKPRLLHQWLKWLDAGQIEKLVAGIEKQLPRRGAVRQQASSGLHYFRDNSEKMRYAKFRRQGLFVGSGVVEAGCRTVIGQRLKQSGMFWSLRGANAIIALRCCDASDRFEDFWSAQAA